MIAINRAGIKGWLIIYSILDSDINTRKHSSSSYYQRSCFHQCILGWKQFPFLLVQNSLWACTSRTSPTALHLLYQKWSPFTCSYVFRKWKLSVTKVNSHFSFYQLELLHSLVFHERDKWWWNGFQVLLFPFFPCCDMLIASPSWFVNLTTTAGFSSWFAMNLTYIFFREFTMYIFKVFHD